MPEGRSSIDDIIDLYKRDVDMSLIQENLKLTPDQRLQKLVTRAKFTQELHQAGQQMRSNLSSALNKTTFTK